MLSNPEAFLGRFKEFNEILESPRGSRTSLEVSRSPKRCKGANGT